MHHYVLCNCLSFYVFYLCYFHAFHASMNLHQSKPPSSLPQPSTNAWCDGWLCWFERAPTSCPTPVTVNRSITLIKNELRTEDVLHDQFKIIYWFCVQLNSPNVGWMLCAWWDPPKNEFPWQNQQLEALSDSKKKITSSVYLRSKFSNESIFGVVHV